VKVVKNKVAAPFRQAEFDIEYGKGISTSGCLIDLGLEHNIVSKSGSFFSYGKDRLGQGRGNAKAHLNENPAVAKEIEEKIYAALGMSKDLVTPIDNSGTSSGAQAGERDTTGPSLKDAPAPIAPSRAQASEPAVAAA
jgi:recombination protein RecA